MFCTFSSSDEFSKLSFEVSIGVSSSGWTIFFSSWVVSLISNSLVSDWFSSLLSSISLKSSSSIKVLVWYSSIKSFFIFSTVMVRCWSNNVRHDFAGRILLRNWCQKDCLCRESRNCVHGRNDLATPPLIGSWSCLAYVRDAYRPPGRVGLVRSDPVAIAGRDE